MYRLVIDGFFICLYSKEEVEKCKQKDLLEEMLREMTGEFPALSEVFVKERDMYLANSLRLAAQPIRDPRDDAGKYVYYVNIMILKLSVYIKYHVQHDP